ncbi:MAG: hypothetical protein HGB20_02035 [Chlorobiaceae bacterium]|nr:hypothetical protein [Chlorobiaceae bacterium]
MKKRMLSLAAMFAALSFASPAHAELKIGGDASIRARGEWKAIDPSNDPGDGLKWQWRVRLKASADLGNGYFFKTMIANEDISGTPGWSTVANNNTEHFQLEVSNFILGRMMKDSHYMMGRLPLNSFNNPIFDLALYPVPTSFSPGGIYAVDVPVFQWNFDRIYALNYGTKLGEGELNATFVVLDNHSTTEDTPALADGFFNDGYALHLSYKVNLGKAVFEPQALIVLTDANGASYQNVSSNTFGANLTIPSGKTKFGLSGFYTVCKDDKGSYLKKDTVDPIGYGNIGYPADNPATTTVEDGYTTYTPTATHVDYHGYLLRAKVEHGPFMAWVDYNRTTDKSSNLSAETTYDNVFVWAQYKIGITESALGTFSLTPVVRVRTSGREIGSAAATHNDLVRAELWATMTF